MGVLTDALDEADDGQTERSGTARAGSTDPFAMDFDFQLEGDAGSIATGLTLLKMLSDLL